MTDEDRSLSKVALLASNFRRVKEEIMAEAYLKAQAEIASYEHNLEMAVLEALDDGHGVTDVARAMTMPGKTPNRNRVYAIKKKHLGTVVTSVGGDYPFRWVARDLGNGRTVYDAVAVLSDFGPDKVTGEFTWRYIAGELEPVLDPVAEPYPNTKYYRSLVDQWLMLNPYPAAEEKEETDGPGW